MGNCNSLCSALTETMSTGRRPCCSWPAARSASTSMRSPSRSATQRISLPRALPKPMRPLLAFRNALTKSLRVKLGTSVVLFALARRCGQPGQQQGRRLPALSSSTTRWIRRLRVVLCLAEMTQQIHSFRASGVRSFQAARVVASELRALRTSAGALCRGPGLLWAFTIMLYRNAIDRRPKKSP